MNPKKLLITLLQLLIVQLHSAGTTSTGGGSGKTSDTKKVAAGCATPATSAYLDFNNVRALIHTGSDMWWDLIGSPQYEVPKGSGKHSLFLGDLWLGGTDVNGQLRIAAQRYRYSGVDFWTGPLSQKTAEITPDECEKWDRFFIITRKEVEEFRAWFLNPASNPGYTIPPSILEWPAHGDPSKGEVWNLAPFYDNDGDGNYNPANGDYPYYDLGTGTDCNRSRNRKPKLFGDYTMWWIFNDKGNIHAETGSEAIGVEIQAQAFAFATQDEINNMTFYNYIISNRSTYTLVNTFFGTNFDPDIGCASDDYVGCDVRRGLGYAYNGDNIDGNPCQTATSGDYGDRTPAIGIDFFEGPYQDADGEDNPTGATLCDASINGLNFGDAIIDNERWGMRRFLYYINGSGVTGDPNSGPEYYLLLRGFWKDGQKMVYGGNGHPDGCPSGMPCIPTDFMFPGNPTTDLCGWGQADGNDDVPVNLSAYPWDEPMTGNSPEDIRFVHSAGPFTLQPGAVNDITTGVVWMQAQDGNPLSSVQLVRIADDKAQALFDNCFKLLNGPDAPCLTIRESDKELILYLTNPQTSNNYQENYEEIDPAIPAKDVNGNPYDRRFRFQGYQIFQLKDSTVSVNELTDITRARLIAQCDISDEISKIINYTFDDEMGVNVPHLMASGEDQGIRHTFRVTDDLFATGGDKRLVNFKKYCFMAIAYAYNNFDNYDLSNGDFYGQQKPFLLGRKNCMGGSMAAETAIPHKQVPQQGGTVSNSAYADAPVVKRLQGIGNGGLGVSISKETEDEILKNDTTETVVYERGKAAIDIKIVDPLNVRGGSYRIRFFRDSATTFALTSVKLSYGSYVNEINKEKRWFTVTGNIQNSLKPGDQFYVSGSSGFDGTYTVFKTDPAQGRIYPCEQIPCTVCTSTLATGGIIFTRYMWELTEELTGSIVALSDKTIEIFNEQYIPDLGISVTVNQVPEPGPVGSFGIHEMVNIPGYSVQWAKYPKTKNSGIIDASITFSDEKQKWLQFIADGDGCNAFNWIRSGNTNNANVPDCNDFGEMVTFNNNTIDPSDDQHFFVSHDSLENFEKIAGGTWAPFAFASKDSLGPAPAYAYSGKHPLNKIASVDLVITPDETKWTRAVVLEMDEGGNYSEGKVKKFDVRYHLSVDKNGEAYQPGGGIDPNTPYDDYPLSANADDANYISARGMGWFPGYAINVETGERLNICFGENSRLKSDLRGDDLLWNPTSSVSTDLGENASRLGYCETGVDPGCPFWAGGMHYIYIVGNNNDSNGTGTSYDGGERIHKTLTGNVNDAQRFTVFNDFMWVGMPLLTKEFNFSDPHQIPSEVRIKIRVNKPYSEANGMNPLFAFSLDEFVPVKSDRTVATDALNLIGAVPNPYLGASGYEMNAPDNRIKIINLPQRCVISIYSVQGMLIRQYDRDDRTNTFLDWDLKNSNGVPVSSGVYIIHVLVPEIGEKTIKWFGALRPVDLEAF